MTIGIIGDGQLALMLAESLHRNSIPFLCLSENILSPMAKAFPERTTTDPVEFQESCDQFTLENEFPTVEDLKYLLKEKAQYIFPNLDSYHFFANKISQRTLYQDLKIPSPKWVAIKSIADLHLISEFHFPFILKSSRGGYDGKGVRVIRTLEEFDDAVADFQLSQGHELLIEEMVAIKQELAQGFLQDSQGRYTLLPLVETVQVNGICQYVYYPPELASGVQAKIQDCIQKLIKKGLVGIFNFEFFVDQQNNVFINEGAPRPHNSQHITIDASNFSQFDLVGLYMTERPGLPRELETKPSSMINILGKSSGKDYGLTLPEVSTELTVHPKLYLKEICSPGRKMGHVNIVDSSGKIDLRDVSQKIFEEYTI